MKNEMIKILIADDHDLIRQGLKRILSFEENFLIVGEAENGEKVMEILKSNKPDVLLLDRNMPVMDGIKVIKQIQEEGIEIKIIMLTIENQRQTIHEAINIGVDGYVLKDSAGEEIIEAIKTVCSGEKYIDKSLVSILFSDIKNINKQTISIFDKLSQRELEVLLRISRGFSNKEISEQLYLSEKTVKNYATSLFAKLEAHDRVRATIIALENHIEDYCAYKDKK